jgi:hypothetical protein
MNNPNPKQEPGLREQRFELAVWPTTPAGPWRAEIRNRGEDLPRRFERPLDLVLYLTQLSDSTQPLRGLR